VVNEEPGIRGKYSKIFLPRSPGKEGEEEELGLFCSIGGHGSLWVD